MAASLDLPAVGLRRASARIAGVGTGVGCRRQRSSRERFGLAMPFLAAVVLTFAASAHAANEPPNGHAVPAPLPRQRIAPGTWARTKVHRTQMPPQPRQTVNGWLPEDASHPSRWRRADPSEAAKLDRGITRYQERPKPAPEEAR